MSTTVETTIVVDVPVSTVYNQWTQFEEFPRFMGGVERVTQVADDRLQWVARIGGVSRQWEAQIVEQVPDRKISWAATEGALNAGSVSFEETGEDRTRVHLVLEYEPEGLVETLGDKLHLVENRAQKDLERFKEFIEAQGQATGAWRGAVQEDADVGTPGVEDAKAFRGDGAGTRPTGTAGAGAAAGGTLAAEAAGEDTAESEAPAWPPLATEGPTGAPRAEDDAPEHAREGAAAFEAEDPAAPGTPTEPPMAPEDTTGAAATKDKPTDEPVLEEGPEGVVLPRAEDSTGQPAEEHGSVPDATGTLLPVPPSGATEDLIPSAGVPGPGRDRAATEPRDEPDSSGTSPSDPQDTTGPDPISRPSVYDDAPSPGQPVPPAGSGEDLIPSTGAPRVAADPDITEQPLGTGAPLDAEPPAEAGSSREPPSAPENTTGAGMGTTPQSTHHEDTPSPGQPVPPAGSTEDLIPSTGAPRVGTDPDITDQPLDVDAPLDAEPPAAPPAGAGPFTEPPAAAEDTAGAGEDTAGRQPPTADDMASPSGAPQTPRVDAPLDAEPVPSLETPPVDLPDAAPPAAGRSRVDPVTGRPVDENSPGEGTV